MVIDRGNWIAAALLGLVSSTYSTLISQLAAARFGRDAAVDWMVVATIPGRDAFLQAHPSFSAVAVGIPFHQWADFSWALFFFAVLGRWTSGLPPMALAAIVVPWAFLTSALEWLLLVPIFPFAQPIFTLQQPYWIGFLVHLASALVYPVFPVFRTWVTGRRSSSTGVVKVWSAGLATSLLLCALLALAGVTGHELRWMGQDKDGDRTFIRHMATHHEQGIELARIAVARARDPHLRALARLMTANQTRENAVFAQWWRSWFDDPMPVCSSEERASMPGLLTPDRLDRLKAIDGAEFDRLFMAEMTYHHAGAVKMADSEIQGAGDPRLKLVAHAIRHEQQGEIALMKGTSGWLAVQTAISNMLRDNVNEP
jgi:uncharacterized protein (DUF305 family)